MKNNERESRKIIICYTGEPRSFLKGLKQRNKIFKKRKDYKFEIETRYNICFMKNNKTSNKFKILKSLKYFLKDKDINSIKLSPHISDNIWTNLICQKYEILSNLYKDSEDLSKSVILLTRTDWFFTNSIIRLINESLDTKKILIPPLNQEQSEYEGKKFKPIFDQFMIIPGSLIIEVLKSLKTSTQIGLKQECSPFHKNLKLGGDGTNRYGIAPESLLGIGFMLNKIENKVRVIDNFSFIFSPDMFGTNPHNLIRDDAHIWMNLTAKDYLVKYFEFLKTKIIKLIKRFRILKLLQK